MGVASSDPYLFRILGYGNEVFQVQMPNHDALPFERDHLKPYPRIAGEVLLFVLTLAVTLPTAYVAYRYIERPGIRLRHRAADKITVFACRIRRRAPMGLPEAEPSIV
jgi:hypothetical protein